MAKLYFHYSTMNAGKSTVLLQAAQADIMAVGKIHTLTWQESDTIELTSVGWGSLDD